MSLVAELFMLAGSVIAVLAAVGLHRFSTPYARFHAAGKASPVAFLVAAIGAGMELGLAGATQLFIAAVAMILTLPVGVHLLFRAVHRTADSSHLYLDELASAELAAAPILRPELGDLAEDPTNRSEETGLAPQDFCSD